MLAHLNHPRFAGTPQVRDLLRLQLDDALAFYDRVRDDREFPDDSVRLDFARVAIQAGNAQHQLGRPALAPVGRAP